MSRRSAATPATSPCSASPPAPWRSPTSSPRPLAKGLFKRAIIQSGHGSMVRDQSSRAAARPQAGETAQGRADRGRLSRRRFRQRLGGDGESWPSRSPASICAMRTAMSRCSGSAASSRCSATTSFPNRRCDALEQGAGSEVELLIGTNAEEMNLYFVPTKVRDKIPALLARWMLGKSNPRAKKALQAYGLGQKGKKARLCHDRGDARPRLPLAGAAVCRAPPGTHPRLRIRLALARLRGRAWRVPRRWNCRSCSTRSPSRRATTGWSVPTRRRNLADRVHRIWVDFARDGSLPWPEFETRQPAGPPTVRQ